MNFYDRIYGELTVVLTHLREGREVEAALRLQKTLDNIRQSKMDF